MIFGMPLYYIEEDEKKRPPLQYIYHFENPGIWTRERFIKSILKQDEEIKLLRKKIKWLGRELAEKEKICNCKTQHKTIDPSIDYE